MIDRIILIIIIIICYINIYKKIDDNFNNYSLYTGKIITITKNGMTNNNEKNLYKWWNWWFIVNSIIILLYIEKTIKKHP